MPLPDPLFDKDGVTLYYGDCRMLISSIPANTVDLVLTDPPYGISLDTGNKARGRGRNAHNVPPGLERFGPTVAQRNDYPPIYGDGEPFDPGHLLHFKRLVLFGANYYADKLPPSPSWLVWDKLNGLQSKREIGFNDAADFEMIWTNLGGAAKIIPHRWNGLMKDSEHRESRVHPTQKPVLLLQKNHRVLDKARGPCVRPVRRFGLYPDRRKACG
jgi:site-specific DNA-methyltransferase (adenine-specific)